MPNHSILNANDPSDYYPFGLMMSGRSWSEGYRYGFNGQEQDDEVYGDGILNTALYWEYDTRLGRRWNIDPVVRSNISGYATFSLNPVYFVDNIGLSPDEYYNENGKFLYKDHKETDDIRIISQQVFDNIQIASNILSKIYGLNISTEMYEKQIAKESSSLDESLQDHLSLGAVSTIYTTILERYEKFDVHKLHNSKISIADIRTIENDGFSSTVYYDTYNKANSTIGALANTDITTIKGEINITVNVNYRKAPFTTTSEVVNFLGVHEFYGHGILELGVSDHRMIYQMQHDHPSFRSLRDPDLIEMINTRR